jgi:hypothetical protein
MDPGRRFMLVGLAVAAAEAALAIVALRTGLTLYLLACAAATAAVAVIARRLVRRPPPRDDEDGGGGPPRGPADEPPPPWWPEFERAFRRHVRERDRPRQPVH